MYVCVYVCVCSCVCVYAMNTHMRVECAYQHAYKLFGVCVGWVWVGEFNMLSSVLC